MRTQKKMTLLAAVAAAVTLAGLAVPVAQAADTPGKPTPAPGLQAPTKVPAPDEAAAGFAATSVSADAQAALSTVQKKIASYVAKNGTTYTFGSWSDPATGAVVVETNAPAKVVASVTALPSTASFAATPVQVTKQGVDDTWHRRDDVPAFYAGGGIAFGGGICSSGYPVKTSSGARYMVTAGHCFANGAAVRTESGANAYGTVVGRALASLGSGPVDMELMTGASYAARVFTGGVTSTSSIPIVSGGNASVGYNAYCHSGRTTGEHCGHTAQSVTGQVCTSSGCKSPVIVFTGGTMIQPGDSGGSFYAKNSSGAYIRGHVIASGGGTGYAETYAKVASRYGVSIFTG